MTSPIALFVYNRPEHTVRVIEALRQNTLASKSILYVFADGPKDTATSEQKTRIEETRRIASNITGFHEVHLMFFEKNKGTIAYLTRNFRSTAPLCGYFNRMFTELMPVETENQSKFEEIPIPETDF